MGVHLFIVPQWITQLFWASAGVLGLVRGRSPERIFAIVRIALLFYPTLSCSIYNCPDVASRVLVSLPMHLVSFSAALALALRYDRYWTLAAASIGLLQIGTDLLALLPGASWWAYASAHVIWCYCLSLLLVVGALTARSRPAFTADGAVA